ncbi:uncharacterized protein LOC136033299 [Artemia franciscana]|uniref:Uncharacterized protein n=1 Tax=Artemia franciscana TaxID=6661 RepID=A0AA88LFF9_ARTSF|nr:hypothetical protein QYM36_001284 [Artemia franciscana]KAK2724740.1 hypothetical protein QYM36_001284 [Artemia franciscana]
MELYELIPFVCENGFKVEIKTLPSIKRHFFNDEDSKLFLVFLFLEKILDIQLVERSLTDAVGILEDCGVSRGYNPRKILTECPNESEVDEYVKFWKTLYGAAKPVECPWRLDLCHSMYLRLAGKDQAQIFSNTPLLSSGVIRDIEKRQCYRRETIEREICEYVPEELSKDERVEGEIEPSFLDIHSNLATLFPVLKANHVPEVELKPEVDFGGFSGKVDKLHEGVKSYIDGTNHLLLLNQASNGHR